MSVLHLLPITYDARRTGTGLLEALQRWRDADWTSTSESHVPERRAIDANRATIERAKGALMRRHGMGNFQAISLMVRWSRLTHTPVHTLARTLIRGVDEADPQPGWRDRPLHRWLEAQTPTPIPDPALSQPTRTMTEPGPTSLRFLAMDAEPGGAGAPHSRR